jgi:peptidyl-dipeptidase Dcp
MGQRTLRARPGSSHPSGAEINAPEEVAPMRKWLVLAALAFPALAAQPATQPVPPAVQAAAPAAPANPFFAEWTTPFGVPPFGAIEVAHYMPAFTEGITRERAEVAAIVKNPEPPTFGNTVVALDGAGEFLDRVQTVFYGQLSAETSDALQAVAKDVAPQLAALSDDINLDPALFARVKTVWEKRDASGLTAEQKKLVDETYKGFVRGGANLDATGQERLRAINKELSLEGLRFGDNVLRETNAYRLVIEKRDDLAGLPPGVVNGAAAAAKAAKLEGKWVFTLQAPSIWPFLQYADNRELRRQILTAYITRCDHGDASDNKAILAKLAALRYEKAKLLGFPTWANFVLDRNMAKTPDKVYGLLDRLWTPALAVAHQEAADLQAAIDADGQTFKLEPWDWRYYSERVKKARYDFDEEALRPYFKLDNVRDGAFYVANKLYGITFTERTDIPKYHSEVRTFEVKDADGSFLGVFMTDYYPRPGKRGGAWSGRYRDQWFKDGKDVRPIVVNVCNFSRPAGDAPALLSLEEAETLFHEFGHGLHSLLSRVHYHGVARVPRDFVELPSQIMENWVLEPEVLKVYAKHWKTGAVIPAELVAKVGRARKFNQGFATVEYLAASYLDMDWHTVTDAKERDATAFENAAMAKIHMPPEIVVRYRSPYFSHIFGPGGGYSAGYYSYIWAEVLVADAFQAFAERGIFDQATARSFRTNILERPGTGDVMEAYVRFRGHEPSVQPLLAKRGLTATPAAPATK